LRYAVDKAEQVVLEFVKQNNIELPKFGEGYDITNYISRR
jgi:hypothetical protein